MGVDVLLTIDSDLFAVFFCLGHFHLLLVSAAKACFAATTALTDFLGMLMFITYCSFSKVIVTWTLATTASMAAHRGSMVKLLSYLVKLEHLQSFT